MKEYIKYNLHAINKSKTKKNKYVIKVSYKC